MIFHFLSKNTNSDNHDNLECHRLVKSYDGKRIEITGLKFPSIELELGKISVEPKLVQAASQALLFLDASQYDLCMSIKTLTDKNIKEEYKKKMVNDKFEAQKIYRALAALSLNVQGQDTQEAVKLLILSLTNNKERTKELEQSDLLSKSDVKQPLRQSHHTMNESQNFSSKSVAGNSDTVDSIELGDESFTENLEKIRHSSNSVEEQLSHTPSRDPKTSLKSIEGASASLNKEMENIRQVILGLNDEYVNSKIEGQLDLKNYWRTLGRTIQEIINDRQYRKIIGPMNADLLERNTIKITGKIKEHNQAEAIGDNQKSSITSKEAELYIGEVLRLLDEIYSSI